jgi:hypothetical protein
VGGDRVGVHRGAQGRRYRLDAAEKIARDLERDRPLYDAKLVEFIELISQTPWQSRGHDQ